MRPRELNDIAILNLLARADDDVRGAYERAAPPNVKNNRSAAWIAYS
jgi:hypothetical protein